jgi:ATP-dependent RNA helicase RhlE
MSFAELGLHTGLVQATQRMGFTSPTPIQRLAIPPLLRGQDVLATAVTGSGKTAAFALPILHHLAPKPRGTTRALVVVPTRELAVQITDHLRELAGQTGVTGAAVYGGVAMGPQEAAFRRGVDVLVATPGRLLDHLQYPYARLRAVEWLVLDEADRMLDMGFLPDIRRILNRVPAERRTLLFSATLPAPIVALAREMLKDPVCLNIERRSAPAAGIAHRAYPVPHDLKPHLLLSLLQEPSARSVLAFTRTKHRANRLADFLAKRGVECARIHGNRSQAQRTEALAGFKRGRFRVLVATDIAARGIDVEALGLVVNVDVPHVPEDYIHRVGRTARASATGEAYTLVSPDEEQDLRAIERHIGKPLPRHRVAAFDYAQRPGERLESRRDAGHSTPGARGSRGPRTTHDGSRGSGSPGSTRGTGRMGAGMAWLRQASAEPRPARPVSARRYAR